MPKQDDQAIGLFAVASLFFTPVDLEEELNAFRLVHQLDIG